MVIDNIWKQGKISETVYNTSKYAIYYPQITSLFSENYIRRIASVYVNALLQACLEAAVHAPPYVLINSRNFVNNGLFEFLNSHDTPPEHTVFQEPPQEKIWYSKFGRPSRPSDVAETRDNSSEHCCAFQRSIATDLMKWPSLLYLSPSRQPRQAIAPAKYSNLKCVSRLRATLYLKATLAASFGRIFSGHKLDAIYEHKHTTAVVISEA